MFYSNTIFSGLGMGEDQITALVGIINFVATLVGMYLLTIAGRRIIMLVTQITIAVVLFLIGYLHL